MPYFKINCFVMFENPNSTESTVFENEILIIDVIVVSLKIEIPKNCG